MLHLRISWRDDEASEGEEKDGRQSETTNKDRLSRPSMKNQ